MARQHGIPVRASFMVGLPFDTDESIEHYFTEAARLAVDEFAVYGLIPYPGTEIFKNPEKYNYHITNFNFSSYNQISRDGESCFALSYDDGINKFTPEDVSRWHKRANELLSTHIRHMRSSTIR